ncbi:MAG: glutathione S-transferase family protein [Caulobacterales bacterium]
MSSDYRIFGSEMSPYSVKVRSYFRYKGLPHRWLNRASDTAGDFARHAKLPIIPLVITPDGEGVQDSTPIIDRIERDHAAPLVHPADPVTDFLSVLIEEFGDEWGNKWMFHYRWTRDVDRTSAAGRIALSMNPGMDEAAWGALTAQIGERMVGRVWFVGSNPQNADFIESGFRAAIVQLDAHLAQRPYLFGARPAYADFALWGQLYEAWTDPTPGALIEARAPNLLAWIHRMLFPRALGEFEAWASLAPTLAPFLRDQVGGLFLPWTVANAAALAAGQDEFTVRLGDHDWPQKPQKYHAKSLQVLRERHAALQDRAAIDPILREAGCLEALSS